MQDITVVTADDPAAQTHIEVNDAFKIGRDPWRFEMKGPLVLLLLGLGVLVACAVVMKKREKKQPEATIHRLREGIDDALGDLESRIKDLRRRAEKASGEARKTLQDQAHDLEGRQRTLKTQLEELRKEAKGLLERATA